MPCRFPPSLVISPLNIIVTIVSTFGTCEEERQATRGGVTQAKSLCLVALPSIGFHPPIMDGNYYGMCVLKVKLVTVSDYPGESRRRPRSCRSKLARQSHTS